MALRPLSQFLQCQGGFVWRGYTRGQKKTAGTRRKVPAASPKACRRSEECTCWLDRYTLIRARDTFRQKLVVGDSCTSILLDAVPRKWLQEDNNLY